MSSSPHLILRIAACLSASCLAAGCSSADSRAAQALAAYQTAAAANDLPGAREALLQLVRAKDDVPDYWVELGKLQASAGSYGEAYYAFTRAYELDRSNPELLRAITELALRAVVHLVQRVVDDVAPRRGQALLELLRLHRVRERRQVDSGHEEPVQHARTGG